MVLGQKRLGCENGTSNYYWLSPYSEPHTPLTLFSALLTLPCKTFPDLNLNIYIL